MAVERTLILVKPDGVRRGLIGEVITRIERKGLEVARLELRQIPTDVAGEHYAEHAERPFYGELVAFITGGPLLALVAEGPRAIEAFRALAGAVLSALPLVLAQPAAQAAPRQVEVLRYDSSQAAEFQAAVDAAFWIGDVIKLAATVAVAVAVHRAFPWLLRRGS